MAWIPHSVTEFGEVEVDDQDSKRKRARIYQRRRRRKRADGVCVPYEAVEEGADNDLRVRCAALNFRANKQAANFRIFNDDFSLALATKRVRVQQRIAGNWTALDLPAVNYRVITKPNKGPDYAAWRWVFRAAGIARLEIEFEQQLGVSKWSYELTNLQATTERFRIVQRFELLQSASSRIDIFRRDSIQSNAYHAGYRYAFAGGEAVNVDWSDMGADFGSFSADPGFGVGDGVNVLSAAMDLASNEVRLVDPTYTSDAGWSADARAGASSAWATGSDFGNATGIGRYAGGEIRTVMRFPISTIGASDDVTSVTLEWYVEFQYEGGTGYQGRIGPHAGTGQIDAQTESPFSTSFSNADNSGDYYVNGLTSIQSTGSKSQSLGSQACLDIEAARAASVANFTISMNAHNMGGTTDCYSVMGAYNNTGGASHQPNLVIVYTEASGATASGSAAHAAQEQATSTKASQTAGVAAHAAQEQAAGSKAGLASGQAQHVAQEQGAATKAATGTAGDQAAGQEQAGATKASSASGAASHASQDQGAGAKAAASAGAAAHADTAFGTGVKAATAAGADQGAVDGQASGAANGNPTAAGTAQNQADGQAAGVKASTASASQPQATQEQASGTKAALASGSAAHAAQRQAAGTKAGFSAGSFVGSGDAFASASTGSYSGPTAAGRGYNATDGFATSRKTVGGTGIDMVAMQEVAYASSVMLPGYSHVAPQANISISDLWWRSDYISEDQARFLFEIFKEKVR